MPVGSHKDAFKAHQLVKKLVAKDGATPLPTLAAEILMDFVKSQRQINQRESATHLPTDQNVYDQEKLKAALEAVGSLCGQCEEAHNDACFVNQARRVLIAARTGVDLGQAFDGKKSLDELVREAERLAAERAAAPPETAAASAGTTPVSGETDAAATGRLRQELASLQEWEVFRSTLIDEIVDTIGKVSAGNYAAKMPVHEDEQLGKLATSFNLMLDAMNATMSHLDHLVNARNAELKQIMNTVPLGLLSLNAELRVNPEYSRTAALIFGVDELRGRDYPELLGLTPRRQEERNALKDYLDILLMGIDCPDADRLNPFAEILLPRGVWVRLRYHLVQTESGQGNLLVVVEDVTETKKLEARVEATQRESAQIKAIAEAPDLFRDVIADNQKILDQTITLLDGNGPASSQERIDAMFRGVHTVKGVAGSFGMSEVGKQAGILENALARARDLGSLTTERTEEIRRELGLLGEAMGDVKKLAKLILGDDSLTGGPALKVSLEQLQELEREMRDAAVDEGVRARMLGKIRDLRLVPAKKALERTIRLVPGLISRLNKQVSFRLEGEDVPLPVELAQNLNGPLIHLIRNAFDHGVEDEELRRGAGKPEQASVALTIHRRERWIEVAVSDDGKGLDPEVLRASAIRKELLSPEEAGNLSAEACLNLIFLPGFSTAASVTEISGRGVGMDVVQTEIANMGGRITIDSTPGKGSRFTLHVPIACS